jgi:hypothetical protein
MSARHVPLQRGVATVAALAAVAVAAPATASAIDSSIYETGVPAGQVEHGVLAFTITGSPTPESRRVEYWVTADRWREQTTDRKTGELIGGRVHDANGTTWLQYKPINGDPRVLHFKGNDSVPGPGFPAPYNRKMAAGLITEGSPTEPAQITLQPIGPRTIVGFAGTAYERLRDGQPGIGRVGEPATEGTHSTVVLQDGTFQPLLTETTGPNGSYGTFDQREVLLSRETTPTAQASVRLTKDGFARTIKGWRAKVKAAKQHKNKK